MWGTDEWRVFRNPETGKFEAVFITDYKMRDEMEKREELKKNPHSNYRNYFDSQEEAEKAISEYEFEEWWNSIFQSEYAEPLKAAIIAAGKEINSGTKMFLGQYKDTMSFHTFAKMAWEHGLILKFELVPKDE